MFFNLFSFFRRRRHKYTLDPDEILLDARNLPSFDTQQFEGRIEKPINKTSIYLLSVFFILVGLIFTWKVGVLQIAKGEVYAERSKNNNLKQTPIFSERGVVYDRNNVELAWNTPEKGRTYIADEGFAHALGYLGYPTAKELERSAELNPKELLGKAGIERAYEQVLRGEKGLKLEEFNVSGDLVTEHIFKEPVPGKNITTAIDFRVQSKLYQYIKDLALSRGFSGGAGVILDVNTGAVLAMTSYPEFSPNVLVERSDAARIGEYFNSKSQPFLNRVTSGLYTPGSIFKPIVAIGALEEKVIDPSKKILSTGSLVVPNPYDKSKPTIFGDWKAHGWTDMREALAVSSDVYFYQVGGGFGDQRGLGIANIDKYAKIFGLAEPTGVDLDGEATGIIPTPEWKEQNFDGEPWRLGNTYHTAIGQYGLQVTPIQMARATAALANGGRLVKPALVLNSDNLEAQGLPLNLKPNNLKIVQEGMRLAVVSGTAKGLSNEAVQVAAKTGTAELGLTKSHVNSWIIGYFPYNNPRYAFTVVMEKGPRANTVGGVFVMRQLIDWMAIYTPEYFR